MKRLNFFGNLGQLWSGLAAIPWRAVVAWVEFHQDSVRRSYQYALVILALFLLVAAMQMNEIPSPRTGYQSQLNSDQMEQQMARMLAAPLLSVKEVASQNTLVSSARLVSLSALNGRYFAIIEYGGQAFSVLEGDDFGYGGKVLKINRNGVGLWLDNKEQWLQVQVFEDDLSNIPGAVPLSNGQSMEFSSAATVPNATTQSPEKTRALPLPNNNAPPKFSEAATPASQEVMGRERLIEQAEKAGFIENGVLKMRPPNNPQ